jgi:hypothetical protein
MISKEGNISSQWNNNGIFKWGQNGVMEKEYYVFSFEMLKCDQAYIFPAIHIMWHID